MTEKRYTHNILGSVFKDGKLFALTDGESQARTLCIELNESNDENEKLKSKNRGLQSELQIFKEDVTHSNLQINKLADENEQLKSEIEELENKIEVLEGKLWNCQNVR